ncbi:MAG TPA: CYTH domain-containing protein [Pseudorhodoplanes sp.]|nr:CYTH domain-containing protein [Pseudorhodoplanes sp.]
MATEVERKFLVTGDDWRDQVAHSVAIRQAYLSFTAAMAIRIRIVDDAMAFLTIKSAEPGIARSEFEYPVPLEDARGLIELRTGQVIEKRRHLVRFRGAQWEIDVFEGAHTGLVIAEIELADENTAFEHPPWLGKEVTGEARYYNVSLAGAHRITGKAG